MKIRVLIFLFLGLAFAVYLVGYVGSGGVFSAAGAIGWSGFAILCLYALVLFPILGAAWQVLLPGSSNKLLVFAGARMVRDAASDVLPFSQLGGIVLGARTAMLHGISQPMVLASTIVDVTTEMLAQIAYIALGVAILSVSAPNVGAASSLTRDFVIGVVLAMAGAAAFLALQRHNHWITEKIGGRLFRRGDSTAAVMAALDAIYRSPARVGVSLALHFAGWIASAFGAWIAFHLIGAQADFRMVVALESLICATRSTTFLIPNALGVQEAAYAVLSPLFGIGAEVGLAVSLLKRGRDIAVGVPILLVWQALEGRRVLGQWRP